MLAIGIFFLFVSCGGGGGNETSTINPPPLTNQWIKTYGGSLADTANAIQQTSDGGYIVAGSTGSDRYSYHAWVVKLDGDGSVLWEKIYGGTGNDHARAVQQTSDGGYIVAGYTYSFGAGGVDAWVFKLDGSGSVLWEKTYGRTGNDYAQAVHQTSDGGYIVAVYTDTFGAGDTDARVLKFDGNGSFTGCSGIGTSNATVNNVSGAEITTSMTLTKTAASSSNSTASVTDTTATAAEVCSGL